MVKSYRWWWGGVVVVAYGILVSPQSQLDFGFFTSLGLGLGLGLGGQGLGLGFDNFLHDFPLFSLRLVEEPLHAYNSRLSVCLPFRFANGFLHG